MENQMKLGSIAMGSADDSWRTPSFRQSVVTKIDEVIQRSGMQMARSSTDMEQQVFKKANTREEYMNMVAKLILHVRELSQSKPNQGPPNMQNNPNQGPNQQQGPLQGPGGQGMAPDPINALQNLASQGSRNQMMNMAQQGQMQQQMCPNPNMQMQMGHQNPMVSQGQPQTATNLLQTLNQRPQLNMQMQNKLGGGMGMVPNQQMANNMGQMSMGSQLQNQLSGPMQSMQGGMQGSMGGGMGPGQMGPGQMGPGQMGQGQMGPGQMGPGQMGPGQMGPGQMGPGQMGPGQMGPGQMGPGQMGPGQMGPGQMGPGQMGMNNSQMVSMLHGHMGGRKELLGVGVGVGGYRGAGQGAGGAAGGAGPQQFLRQSPSPSAASPMQGPHPSPASMGVMGGAMPSPMSMGMSCAVASPSSNTQHMPMHSQHQRGVGMGMVSSPQSLNTPSGANVASPCGEEAAYRDKVRQLSKYIEPLRRMVHRMVSEGENVDKLTKMKSLLDILTNPNMRVPLETLIKCEVALEKLDFFKRSDVGFGLPSSGKEQMFNPLLEVVNNCLQSPLANHTLKRTFGSTLDALDGPDIKNLPSPLKVAKTEDPPLEIPDVLQGEIARLDSRFKISLDPMQPAGSTGSISLVAALDDARLPCVPAVAVTVPRGYPSPTAPAPAIRLRHRPRAAHAHGHHPHESFLNAIDKALEARCARLPKSCSVGQLLDAWEMSVRQACAPSPMAYAPIPALGL